MASKWPKMSRYTADTFECVSLIQHIYQLVRNLKAQSFGGMVDVLFSLRPWHLSSSCHSPKAIACSDITIQARRRDLVSGILSAELQQ